MLTILGTIQGFVNLLFVIVIFGTLIVSWIFSSRLSKVSWFFSDRLSKNFNAQFPWGKVLSIIGLEILVCLGFNLFFEFFKAYWLWITIGTIIVLFIIMSRKKKRYG